MSAQDRIYERKFAKLIQQISSYPRKRKGEFRGGRFFTFNASKDRTPAGVKIGRLVTMRIRLREWRLAA
jgi:hypothetical protein